MSNGTGLAMGRDRRVVVVKRAAPGPPAERLRREAGMLRLAVHPGVVEVVDDESDGDEASISTAFVGGGTLSDFAVGGDLRLGVRALATVATTLADLHDRGITHGRVTGDHVLMADVGQAVLCGLAEGSDTGARSDTGRPSDAGAPGETGPVAVSDARSETGPAEVSDDVRTNASAAQRNDSAQAGDVLALATLVREVALEGSGPQVEPLQRIAERALAPDPAVRPSMRQMATSLHNLDPTPPSPAPGATGPRLLVARSPRGRTGRRRGPLAVVVATLAAVAIAMATLATVDRPPRGEAAGNDMAGTGNTVGSADPVPPTQTVPAPGMPTTSSLMSGATPTTTSSSIPTDGPSEETAVDGSTPPPQAGPPAVRVWPAPTGGTAPIYADVDGDGTIEAVEVTGGIVTAAGIRWQVAAPDE
ncbi:MAG: hypothetical protein ACR2G7_11435, partial [Acidimicrobiales bacterium]